MTERHPQHDAITAALRAWYSTAAPAMGYDVARRPFGFYLHHSAGVGEVTLSDAGLADVPALLADVRTYYGDLAVGLYIDDQKRDARLGPALVAAGCQRGAAESHLAHVGATPAVRRVPGIILEPMTEASLVEWSMTKLQGFANSEDEVSHRDNQVRPLEDYELDRPQVEAQQCV
jgi:hypothetical protein